MAQGLNIALKIDYEKVLRVESVILSFKKVFLRVQNEFSQITRIAYTQETAESHLCILIHWLK